MEVWVVIVETKGGHVFCGGVFDTWRAALDCMLPYSDKYGQDNAWINKRIINGPIPEGY